MLDRKSQLPSLAATNTALVLGVGFGAAGFLALFSLLWLIPTVKFDRKLRIAAGGSTFVSALLGPNFEVFESKGEGGWRWRQAVERSLPAAVKTRLRGEIYKEHLPVKQMFDDAYNPSVDDQSTPKPEQKEQQPQAEETNEEEEESANTRFIQRKLANEQARSDETSITEFPAFLNIAGGKQGWSGIADTRKIRRGVDDFRGRKKVAVPVKAEDAPPAQIEGPVGFFRDKRPDWLKMFDDPATEESKCPIYINDFVCWFH